MRSRILLTLAVTILALGVAGTRAPNASAHASYDHSNPSDKQVLSSSPPQLTVTFVSSIVASPGSFAFVSNGDTDESAGPATISPNDPDTLVLPLQPNLPNGKYNVFWKSTDADDGGVTFGRFTFFVGNPTASDLSSTMPGVSVAVPDDATQNALNPMGTQPEDSNDQQTMPAGSTTPMNPAMPMGPGSSMPANSGMQGVQATPMPMSPGMPMSPASP